MAAEDQLGIPACLHWTVDEVANWVDSIGYGKYKENFRSHFINGQRLLSVDPCVLPKMGITNFNDILGLSKIISCLPNQRAVPQSDASAHPRGPAPPVRLREIACRAQRPPVVPWWNQPRHVTFVEHAQLQSRCLAARLANQPQFYMGP